MDDGHLERILRQVQSPELVQRLADLSAPDLQTLMLEVHRRRALSVTPKKLLDQYGKDGYVRKSGVNPLTQVAFDTLAMSLVEGFEPVELSPLAPFGVVSGLTKLGQDNAVSTSRNNEVVSDCTNVLALESGLRRKADPAGTVRLCASHRLTRTRSVKEPASFAHFRLFALTIAGRAEPDYAFEVRAILEQAAFYLRLLGSLGIESSRILFTELEGAPPGRLFGPIREALSAQFPKTLLEHDPENESGKSYYQCIRFRVFASTPDGTEHFLADGGLTDWTQQLLNNRKERFAIGAIGSERIATLFPSDKWAKSHPS
ncbi:MAG: hypothetical protein ACAH95_08955 [Fimbriimonas sp.]